MRSSHLFWPKMRTLKPLLEESEQFLRVMIETTAY